MANVLIVHASRHGQTAAIAQRMGVALGARGHDVELLDAAHPQPALELERFEGVIVGSPIYVGKYLPPIVRWVREHRALLERVPSAFFSVNLAIASRTSDGLAETQPIADAFFAKTGWRPARVALLAGALPYTRYNFLIRFVMRRIAGKAGGDTDTSRDHEYTDWAAVERFAAEFAAALPAAADEGRAEGRDEARPARSASGAPAPDRAPESASRVNF